MIAFLCSPTKLKHCFEQLQLLPVSKDGNFNFMATSGHRPNLRRFFVKGTSRALASFSSSELTIVSVLMIHTHFSKSNVIHLLLTNKERKLDMRRTTQLLPLATDTD